MIPNPEHLQQPVLTVARRDAATLRQDLSVREALEAIRGRELGEKIVYFYVVDADDRLAGVLPTRRLLTAALDARLRDIMVPRVVAIPQTATLLEACEAFVLHKFLAFPVVDEQRRIVGVVDVSFFTQEVFDMAGEEEEPPEHVFEAIGFHVAQVRDASPLRAFRFRFPWLLATIGSGTLCALLAGPLRGDAGQEPGADVLPDDGARAGRKREHSVHDGRDPGPARDAADAAVVCAGVPARGGHGVAVGRRLRDGGGHHCLAVAGGRPGRHEHRREPVAGFVRGVPVRLEHPGGIARAEAGPENRRRAGDACLHRYLHPVVLFWDGRVAAVKACMERVPRTGRACFEPPNRRLVVGPARPSGPYHEVHKEICRCQFPENRLASAAGKHDDSVKI